MNSNKIFYLFLLSVLSSCGVKSQPLKPPEKAIKSYTESYTGPISEEESKKSSSSKKKK